MKLNGSEYLRFFKKAALKICCSLATRICECFFVFTWLLSQRGVEEKGDVENKSRSQQTPYVLCTLILILSEGK